MNRRAHTQAWATFVSPTQTPAQRKAAERARNRAEGFERHDVWVHPDDWARAQRYLMRLQRRRRASQKEPTA